ncbi:MAG: hypothetical protein ACOYNC_15100 [Bacteroidales bacterium]
MAGILSRDELATTFAHSSAFFGNSSKNSFHKGPAWLILSEIFNPMETLSHIIASFDIFQVILNAFPGIFSPIVHAFQGMFTLFAEIAGEQFASHPGLISGTFIFLVGYITWSGLSKLRRVMVSSRQVSPSKNH